MRKEQHEDMITEVRRKKSWAPDGIPAIKIKLSEDTIRPEVTLPSAPDELLQAEENAFYLALGEAAPVHAEIARKTIKLVTDGMSVFVAGGPIAKLLAIWLPIEISVTAYTFDLETAINLNKHENIRVVVLGGQLLRKTEHSFMAYQAQALLDIRPDLYLLEAEALSVANGISTRDWEMAQVMKALLSSAQQTVALCESANLNSAQTIHVCTPNRLAGLVTELEPQHPHLEKFIRAGLKTY